jgi:hypothetical protein
MTIKTLARQSLMLYLAYSRIQISTKKKKQPDIHWLGEGTYKEGNGDFIPGREYIKVKSKCK